MTRGPRIPRVGDSISWVHIAASGAERQRIGQVWADGPRVHASPTFWVRPVAPVRGEPALILVCRPARRVRCGRSVVTALGPRYGSGAGRYVEVHELFAEDDERGRLGRLQHAAQPDQAGPAPTAIHQPPIPPAVLASFMVMGGGPAGDVHPGLYPDEEGAIDRVAQAMQSHQPRREPPPGQGVLF